MSNEDIETLRVHIAARILGGGDTAADSALEALDRIKNKLAIGGMATAVVTDALADDDLGWVDAVRAALERSRHPIQTAVYADDDPGLLYDLNGVAGTLVRQPEPPEPTSDEHDDTNQWALIQKHRECVRLAAGAVDGEKS